MIEGLQASRKRQILALFLAGSSRSLLCQVGRSAGIACVDNLEAWKAAWIAMPWCRAHEPWLLPTSDIPAGYRLLFADLAVSPTDERPHPAPTAPFGSAETAADDKAFAQSTRVPSGPTAQAPARAPLKVAVDGSFLWQEDKAPPLRLGGAHGCAEGLSALRQAARDAPRDLELPESTVVESARQVLFGPQRVLSDPSSKAVLRLYRLPLPTEELCTSPSRAAHEARRMGYPVRMALASPDLRGADYPELVVDGVDHTARVKAAYRDMVSFALAENAEARVLGVTVSVASSAAAVLNLQVRPASATQALVELGFADAHGQAAGDRIAFVLPGDDRHLVRSLFSMAGSPLLAAWHGQAVAPHAAPNAGGGLKQNANDDHEQAPFGSVDDAGLDAEKREPPQAQSTPGLQRGIAGTTSGVQPPVGVEALVRCIEGVGALALHHHHAIASIRITPLALLVDGSIEIREASIQVSDAFEREIAPL